MLADVESFGTDGEQTLVDSLQHEFSNDSHLTCCVHVMWNTKAKLQELEIAGHQRNVIPNDLLGQKEGSHYSGGLVDTSSSMSVITSSNARDCKKVSSFLVTVNLSDKHKSW